jgi:hypothetical protein
MKVKSFLTHPCQTCVNRPTCQLTLKGGSCSFLTRTSNMFLNEFQYPSTRIPIELIRPNTNVIEWEKSLLN